MKVIAIVSSPKGKNSTTLRLVNAALEGARAMGAETEIVDVTKHGIKYCLGCTTCYKKGRCVQKDDLDRVLEKVLAADGIILSSPNYIDGITAQLKALFDRMANVIHEQLLDGKYGFSLATAGGSGDEAVINIMNAFLAKAGATVIGGAGALARDGPAAMDAAIKKSNLLGRELVEAVRGKKKFPEQEAARKAWREHFAFSLKANKESWAHNYRRWVEKGWIKE